MNSIKMIWNFIITIIVTINMKYIITEEQNDRIFIIRRLPEVIEYIRELPPYRKPCNAWDLEGYIRILKKFFFGTIGPGSTHFNNRLRIKLLKDTNFTWELIMGHYGDEIHYNYIKNCEDK